METEYQASAENNFEDVSRLFSEAKAEINKIIVGQEELVEQVLIALFAEGHILIEGVPGIAKTLTAKLTAKIVDTGFSRIQFTPDLMPTDIIGTVLYNLKTNEFTFNKGPIFSNIILIDEINRAPAKTQAALFEVMEERQVTADGTSYKMEDPFFVIASQNPIEQEGTYKLPEAQLDRFLFRIRIDYPSIEEEYLILSRFKEDFRMDQVSDVKAVIHTADLLSARKKIEAVTIKDDLLRYIAQIVYSTRNNKDLFLGASPRASLAIMKTSKVHAALNGRNFVTPDDIKAVVVPVLNHRLILAPEREMEGTEIDEVIKGLVSKVQVPR